MTAPTTGTEGETVTVNWTVQEVGSGTATGSWSDAVYLSDTPVFSPDAQFLTRVEHTGSLGPGQSYSASASVTLNNVLPGNNYFLVRTNDLNDIFEGLATANNTAAASADQLRAAELDLEHAIQRPVHQRRPVELLPGHACLPAKRWSCRSRAPAAAGRPSFMSAAVRCRRAASLTIAAACTLVSRIATSGRADDPAGNLLRPGLRRLRFVPRAAAYTITAETAGFGISGVSPKTGGNAGSVTVDISGTGLNGATQASLLSPGGTVIAATATQFGDASQLYATFNLTGLPTGTYGVQLKQAGQTVTDSGAFTVTTGTPGHLSFQFNVPGATRAGQAGNHHRRLGQRRRRGHRRAHPRRPGRQRQHAIFGRDDVRRRHPRVSGHQRQRPRGRAAARVQQAPSRSRSSSIPTRTRATSRSRNRWTCRSTGAPRRRISSRPTSRPPPGTRFMRTSWPTSAPPWPRSRPCSTRRLPT